MNKFSERVHALVKHFEPHESYDRCRQAQCEMIMQEGDALEKRIEYLERSITSLIETRGRAAVDSIRKKI